MTFRKFLAQNRARHSSRVGLAIASFVIYCVATLVLKEHQYSNYRPEQYTLAAVISNLVYGAPIGTVYSGVMNAITSASAPVQQTFELAAAESVEPGRLLETIPDGNGIGFSFLATLAMRLFGVRILSLTLLLMTLMGASTVLYVLRYRDRRLLFIPLYFFSLTLIYFTPFATDQRILNETPVGGIRYFTLLAILPAMHLFLELADSSRGNAKANMGDAVLLGLQSLIFAAVMFVRGSAGYLVGAIVVAFILAGKANWHKSSSLRLLLKKGVLIGALCAAFAGIFYLWAPTAYIDSGRATGVVWHRVLISLGANPAWPFGQLAKDYAECKRFVPEGLALGTYDRTGHCVWAAYTVRHGMRAQTAVDEIYDAQYEKVMREAFFEIARKYPREVLETFIFYKPRLIFSSLDYLVRPNLPGKFVPTKSLLLFLLLAQFGCLVLFAIQGTDTTHDEDLRILRKGIFIFAIFSLAPYIVAWSNGPTSAELLFYIFFAFGLVLVSAAGFLRGAAKLPRIGPS